MKPYSRWLKTFFSVIVLLLIVAAWMVFAPLQLGGQAAYVIVAGNSMEPGFRRGDLVILWQSAEYQIGDAVAYRHPEIGSVFHRIIARDASRNQFIFKGDNNGWIDSYQPIQSELIGKFWLRLPFLGRVVEQLRVPWIMALLAAAAATIVIAGMMNGHGGHSLQRRGPRRTEERRGSMSSLGESKGSILWVWVTLGLASLALAVFTFTRPVTRTVAEELPFEHSGVFSYSAAAPPGIYDSEAVQSGEPIFRHLTNQVMLNFAYQFLSDQTSEVGGTGTLVAEVGDSNGWKRRIELMPPTPFSGGAFSASGVLDLTQVQALIDSLESQTGLERHQYILGVAPEIAIRGRLGEEELQDRFAPRLTFRWDDLQMQVLKDDLRGADPLRPSQKGVVKHSSSAPNTLAFLSLNLVDVSTARGLALLGILLSIGGIVIFELLIPALVAAFKQTPVDALDALDGLLGLGALAYQAAHGDEPARIRLKYGPLLIASRDDPLPDSGAPRLGEAREQVIEVANMDDLARLAEKDGRMILCQTQGAAHHYLVRDGGLTYRYQCGRRSGSNGHRHGQVQVLAPDEAIIESWSRILELSHKETYEHFQRVTEMTLRLARALGISTDELMHIRRGALLHDVGKIAIPDNILRKPGPLTEEEWTIVRKHPAHAYELLAPIPHLRPALDIPYCHHERWDGTGYPRGLKGEEIPLAARIFAVVETWDALCSERPYRSAWSEDQVREHIRGLAGQHFDPKLVETFLRIKL